MSDFEFSIGEFVVSVDPDGEYFRVKYPLMSCQISGPLSDLDDLCRALEVTKKIREIGAGDDK